MFMDLSQKAICVPVRAGSEASGKAGRSGAALAQLHREVGGGVPIPGGVPETHRCCTWGHGQWAVLVLGWWSDLGISEAFPISVTS